MGLLQTLLKVQYRSSQPQNTYALGKATNKTTTTGAPPHCPHPWPGSSICNDQFRISPHSHKLLFLGIFRHFTIFDLPRCPVLNLFSKWHLLVFDPRFLMSDEQCCCTLLALSASAVL